MAKELIIGDIYLEGLKGIAEKNGVTLEQAAKLAIEDCIATKGTEHIPYIKGALRKLTAQPDSEAKKPEV